MEHPALGPLYGKAPPGPHILNRLHRMHAPFCLTWRPGDSELPGRWVLWERSGDPAWRDAGLARRDRYMATSDTRKALTVGIWQSIEQAIMGLHWWGEWPEEGCFSDTWFDMVAQGLAENAEEQWAAVVRSNQREEEAKFIHTEGKDNPAYLERLRASMPELAQQIDELSRDTFAKVCRGAVSVGYTNKRA